MNRPNITALELIGRQPKRLKKLPLHTFQARDNEPRRSEPPTYLTPDELKRPRIPKAPRLPSFNYPIPKPKEQEPIRRTSSASIRAIHAVAHMTAIPSVRIGAGVIACLLMALLTKF